MPLKVTGKLFEAFFTSTSSSKCLRQSCRRGWLSCSPRLRRCAIGKNFLRTVPQTVRSRHWDCRPPAQHVRFSNMTLKAHRTPPAR